MRPEGAQQQQRQQQQQQQQQQEAAALTQKHEAEWVADVLMNIDRLVFAGIQATVAASFCLEAVGVPGPVSVQAHAQRVAELSSLVVAVAPATGGFPFRP